MRGAGWRGAEVASDCPVWEGWLEGVQGGVRYRQEMVIPWDFFTIQELGDVQ